MFTHPRLELFRSKTSPTSDVKDEESLLVSSEAQSEDPREDTRPTSKISQTGVGDKIKARTVVFISLLFFVYLTHSIRDAASQILTKICDEHEQINVQDVVGCRYEDMTVRREWSTLPLADRIAYTDAVNCLYDLPSKLDANIYPGAKSRFDDFVALHVNKTLVIHISGFFLPWHRHFLRIWHSALKNECGFQGELPYWDWTKYSHNFYDNLLFDGSPGSMSGDGEFDPDNKGVVDFPGKKMPIGKGGGCITSGPFKGRMMNLGPYSFRILAENPPTLPSEPFGYNPRCLSRDLNPTLARLNHNQTTVDNLLKSQTLEEFQIRLSGEPRIGTMENNPHAAGHFMYGGAGNDFFASNADPVFYLHHTQVDRMWAKWQAVDPISRQCALDGTHTAFNRPPTTPVTLDDLLDLGLEDDGKTKVKDAMTKNGPLYCYRYDDE